MNQFFSFGQQPQNNKNKQNDYLTDFKYILSNQHSKQFHLVDNPDLIFQLAQYKFQANNISKNRLEAPSSQHHSKKFYRHKSQQQSITLNSFYNNLKQSKDQDANNLQFEKFKETTNSFQQQIIPINYEQLSDKMKKIDFHKQKALSSKNKQRQGSFKMEFKNQKQKQNLYAKILSVPRPMTSNLINLKSNKQSQTKATWKKVFERKKYSDLKGKLQLLIKNVQKCQDFNFSQVFQYEQAILKDYLSSLVTELKKQCLEKGQLIEIIWNTFFTLINKIMKILITKNRTNQKTQLQTEINLHEGYQQMYLYEANKIIEVSKKYNESKNVIDRLIYQLRYKRKQVKKLYKSLAICNDKLNEYKIEHIDLQNEHIDLLIQSHQMDKDEAVQILKRKLQVNKQKYLKFRVGLGKQKMKQKIEFEIQQQKLKPQEQEKFKKQLFEKINSVKYKKKITTTQQKQQSHVIQEFIQKFSNKYIEIQPPQDDVEICRTMRRPQRMSTAINTDGDYKCKNQLTYSVTQTTFSDKLQFSLINNRSTQTPGNQKIKKTQTVQIQVDGDQIKMLHTKSKMTFYKTIDLSFLFDLKKRDQKIKQVFQGRRSEFSFKKDYKNNNSISELSSDGSQSNQKIMSKKGMSKNIANTKKEKKTSIFNSTLPNYANVKGFNKSQNNKNDGSNTKIHKKRISEIPDISQLSFQENQGKRRQSQSKKRPFLSPQSFQKGANRPSICISNVDSFTQNFSINEEKQKYIESYIMNKDQQYEVLQQNAIFDAFKDIMMDKNKKKSSFFYNSNFNNVRSQIIETNKEHDSENQSQYDFLHPKQALSSFDKLKDSSKHKIQSQFKRSGKKTHSMMPPSLTKLKQGNFKQEKQSLKQTHFLNKIIQFTVKKSLIRKKVDSSNFNACKQKSQFTSITQKLDPFMLDIQFLINQNFTKKRKQNLINIKSANKFIMMTYSRSIDKIYRNNSILENLIKPLFESFEVIYGALKPNDIYRKMVAFISDIVAVKENQNFKEFIFFLGLDKDNLNSAYLTTFDVCLFLKLLEKLNLGGKIAYQIESVFTSRNKVNSQLLNVLESENISYEIIQSVMSKIKDLLQKLEEFIKESRPTQEETKINLFKVSRMIVQQIIKIRIQALKKIESYITGSQNHIEVNLKDIQKMKNQQINVQPVLKIIDCCRIATCKKLYFSKYIEELCLKDEKVSGKKTIKKSELGILLVRIGVVNFEQLEERVKFIQQRNQYVCLLKNGQQELNNEVDLLNFSNNLQRLKMVESQCNCILDGLLGDLRTIYEIGLIKNLEIKRQRNKLI